MAIVPQARGTIGPRLYGHFAEHLGRCCYDGLWVGRDSAVPNIDGFRRDVVEALREVGVPLLRWPGGCYADHYHWRDGIGANRAVRLGTSCGLRVRDENTLGTHEFLRLCALIGAEPYLAANVGTGSVQEFLDWVEYVNADCETDLAAERAQNGRAQPWGVRLWGVGNESWDCGGRLDPASYAREFRRYATMVRHIDPSIELVAVGYEDEWHLGAEDERDWNARVLETLGGSVALVDHLSIHRYWVHGGPGVGFDEADYYALLNEAQATETTIERTVETLARYSPRKKIGIALDEWGVWHPENRDWGPGAGPVLAQPTFEQPNTLRDALAAAIGFEVLHAHCDAVSMANIAQVVNTLQALVITDGATAVRTPTFHAFVLSRPHAGADAVETELDGGVALPDGSPALSCTASVTPNGAAISFVNRHLHERSSVRLEAAGRTVRRARVLTGDRADSVNTVAAPDAVALRDLEIEHDRGWLAFQLPPHSMATVEFVA